jgi:hypothetical protein
MFFCSCAVEAGDSAAAASLHMHVMHSLRSRLESVLFTTQLTTVMNLGMCWFCMLQDQKREHPQRRQLLLAALLHAHAASNRIRSKHGTTAQAAAAAAAEATA